MTFQHILPILLVVAALVIFAIVRVVVTKMRGRPAFPVMPKKVLTTSELAFYRKLINALDRIGGVDVMPQVSMAAIMDTRKGIDAQEARATRNRFDRKIIDFVVVDADTNVLLIIELDDWSHEGREENDRLRDSITASAGYKTLRIKGKTAKDEREIERQIRQLLT